MLDIQKSQVRPKVCRANFIVIISGRQRHLVSKQRQKRRRQNQNKTKQKCKRTSKENPTIKRENAANMN